MRWIRIAVFSHCPLSSKRSTKPNASSRLRKVCVSQLIHSSVNMSTSPITSPRLKHEQPTRSGVNVVRLLRAETKTNNSRRNPKVFLCPMQLLDSRSSHVTSSNINRATRRHTVLSFQLGQCIYNINSCLHHHKSNQPIQSSQLRCISLRHIYSNHTNLCTR